MSGQRRSRKFRAAVWSARALLNHGRQAALTAGRAISRSWKFWLPVLVFVVVYLFVVRFTKVEAFGVIGGFSGAVFCGWKLWTGPVEFPSLLRLLDDRATRRALVDVGIVQTDDEPVKVLARRDHPTGEEIDIVLPRGHSHSEIAAKAEHLAHALNADTVEVFSPRPQVVTFRLRTKPDPLLLGAGTWPLLMGPDGRPPTRRSFADPIPVGVNESGELALVSLYSSSVLVGGVPGSGKSVGVEELLYGAALCPEVCLVVVDLKGGMELSAVDDAGRADYFVEHTAELASVLRRLMAEVVRRQQAVRAIPRLRKIEPDMWAEFPPLVLIIDELAEATASGDKETDREVNDLLRRLVALGRSTGLSVVASTQRPSSDLVPTSFRDLFRHRWGFRTSTPAMSAIVMGEANRDHSQGPHDIPDAMPGVSFIGDERGKRQRVRSFYITDAQIDTLAARAADAHQRSGWTFELPPDPKPPAAPGCGDDAPKRTRRTKRTAKE